MVNKTPINHFKTRLCLTLLCLISLAVNQADASLDVEIESIEGGEQSLEQYIGHGRWVILNIWGTRCPPCREEVPELVRFHDEHKDTDAIVVGIAIDFPSYGYARKSEVIKFADDYFIDFPLLLSDASITEKIGLGRLEGLPTTYVFTPRGDIAAMQVGGITQQILEDFINKTRIEKSRLDKSSIEKTRLKTSGSLN